MLFAVGCLGGPWALERPLEVGPSDGFLTGTRGPYSTRQAIFVDFPAHRATKDFCHPSSQIKNGNNLNNSELAHRMYGLKPMLQNVLSPQVSTQGKSAEGSTNPTPI